MALSHVNTIYPAGFFMDPAPENPNEEEMQSLFR